MIDILTLGIFSQRLTDSIASLRSKLTDGRRGQALFKEEKGVKILSRRNKQD